MIRVWRRVCVIGMGLSILVGACGTEAGLEEGGDTIRDAPPDQIYSFTTLAEMVATSDAVILGQVTSVEPGRTVADGQLQFRSVYVKVEETLYGSVPNEVVLEEEGWVLEPGEGMVPTEPALRDGESAPGDYGFFVVSLKKDSPADQAFYRLINSQGLFLARGTDTTWADVLDTENRPTNSLTFEELREELEKAAEQAEAGSVSPVTPGP